MRNDELAEMFEEIGDLLEIRGDEFYKIQAYRRAARTLLDAPVAAESLYREGKLDTLPNIGKALSAKIAELLQTGRLEFLEKLRAEVPQGVRDLLRVPGLGPRKAGQLFRDLGITSLDALEHAAAAGQLRDLPGMGTKTEQNILSGIAYARRQMERIPLKTAHGIVQGVLAVLEACPAARKPVAVGSYRRGATTVGDIDLMATSDTPEEVLSCFTRMPTVAEVLGCGDTKASVRLQNGYQVDLRVVPHESYGALLHHFTGSKEHNLQLRNYARSRGLSINEYGVLDERTGQRTPCATEEELFDHLGLPFIPPELREGSGEIEAAREGRLPNLVTLKQVRGDLHTHSTYSDGRHTIREMALAARSLGYEYIAVCDHGAGRAHAGGLSVERLREQAREIDALNAEGLGIRILKGTESDIRVDGSLDYPEEVLAELDIVVASVHSAMRQSRQQMTERILRAMRNPYCRIIGHPSGRLLGSRESYEVDLEALFAAAAETGTALEINAMPDRLDLEGLQARQARLAGAPLAINTDAHRTEHLGGVMPFGVTQARRGWLEARDVLNCLPLAELGKALERRPG